MSSLDVRNNRGYFFVETSCMRGGKTGRLIDVAERLDHSAHRCLVFTCTTNVRDGTAKIVSAGSREYPAQAINPEKPEEIEQKVREEDQQEYVDVVIIDEGNFYGPSLVRTIERLRQDKRRIIMVGGLNWDFRGEPFGAMGALIPRADRVNHHQPYCQVQTGDGQKCQALASYTIRAIRTGIINNIALPAVSFFENGTRDPVKGFVFAPYWHPTIQVENPNEQNTRYTVACPQHFLRIRREETIAVEDWFTKQRRGVRKDQVQQELKFPDLGEIVEFLTRERRIRVNGDVLQAMSHQRDPYTGMAIPNY